MSAALPSRWSSGFAPRRASIAGAMALLFLSALPDAMVVPVLRQLMVDRFDVGVGLAHTFMTVNLVGALLAAWMLNGLHRRAGARTMIALAAAANGMLLWMITAPVGLWTVLALRCLEGAADLIVLSLLFHYLAGNGAHATRGRRMGGAVTCLMMGIACGIGTGAVLGAFDAMHTLRAGALACIIVSGGAVLMLPSRRAHVSPQLPSRPASALAGVLPLWPSIVMMFWDRALAGILAVTLPLYLSLVLEWSPGEIGMLIGVGMLVTALGAWPAGRLAERIGPWPLRLGAGIGYGLCFAALPMLVREATPVAAGAMIIIGGCGAALFSTSALFVCESRRGASGMGAYHAAGNAGFLFGPATAAVLLTVLGGSTPGLGDYQIVMAMFAAAHLLGGGIALGALRRPASRPMEASPDSVALTPAP